MYGDFFNRETGTRETGSGQLQQTAQGNPESYGPQEGPESYGPQGNPQPYGPQENPESYRSQEGPQPYGPQESPQPSYGPQGNQQPYLSQGNSVQYIVQGNPQQLVAVRVTAQKKVSKMLEKIQNHFLIYGCGCMLYGLLFAICLYPGFRGISVSVLSAVSMAGLLGIFYHLSLPIRKSIIFYFAAWGILSASSWLTGSGTLIFFNTVGMFLLFLSILFTHFCGTSRWGFGKFAFQMLLAPFVSLGFMGSLGKSFSAYLNRKEKGKSVMAKYIWLGVAISVPLLIILTSLLVSADAVFRSLFGELFQNIRFPAHPFYAMFLLFAGFVGTYCMLAYFASGQIDEAVREKKKWEPVVGITFLSIITVMYLIFSFIQVSYLFVGGFRLPEGYTYASYAREGFFQLLFVCMINLGIILICISWFRQHMALKAVLTVFSCCTFVMIASSAMRMLLYIETYQLTFLRVLVLWALALITVLLIGCIITIYYNEFPLFQFSTVAVTLFYILFSLARPDYHIARYNLRHYEDVDIEYIFSLSSDAIPALEEAGVLEKREWETEEGSWHRYYINNRLEKIQETYEEMGIRDFNFSYQLAGKILEWRIPAQEEENASHQ